MTGEVVAPSPESAVAESPDPALPRATLLLIVLLGFVARLGINLLQQVVATDAYYYVRIAKMVLAWDWWHIIDHGYHPAYPVLVAIFSIPFGSAATGGAAVSILLGTLTVVPAWFIGRRLAGVRGAAIAAFLVAVHPDLVEAGGDVLVEATFVFFFLSSVALALRAATTFDIAASVGAGLFAAAAYLTRPEGLLIPAVACPFMLVVPAALPRFAARRFLAAVLLGAAFLAAAGPYLLVLHSHYGRWMITPKAGGAAFQSNAPLPEKGSSQKKVEEKSKKNPLALPWFLTRKLGDTVYLGFVPLVLLALCVRPDRTPPARLARLFLLLLFALYMPPLIRLLWSRSYLSTRHLLCPAVLLVLASAPAAVAALSRRHARGLSIALFVIAAVALPRSLRPQRQDHVPLKQAGLWMKANAPGVEFMGPEKTAFYADVFFYKIPKGGTIEIGKKLHETKKEWLIVPANDYPTLAAELDPRFVPEITFGKGDDAVAIFHFRD